MSDKGIISHFKTSDIFSSESYKNSLLTCNMHSKMHVEYTENK